MQAGQFLVLSGQLHQLKGGTNFTKVLIVYLKCRKFDPLDPALIVSDPYASDVSMRNDD
jgi:hypothetical protein